MINYRLHLPKKMGVKLLYPRRRGLIFKMLAFCTFIGFIGLWFKNDDPENIEADIILRKSKKEWPKDIPVVDNNIQTHKPIVAQVVQPEDQIMNINNEIDHNNFNKEVIKNLQNKNAYISEKERLERLKADRWFAEDERKVMPGLGERGQAVNLNGEEAKLVDAAMKKEAFNIIASDRISLNRSVPDSRDPL